MLMTPRTSTAECVDRIVVVLQLALAGAWHSIGKVTSRATSSSLSPCRCVFALHGLLCIVLERYVVVAVFVAEVVIVLSLGSMRWLPAFRV